VEVSSLRWRHTTPYVSHEFFILSVMLDIISIQLRGRKN
jgi:hypothetical protein